MSAKVVNLRAARKEKDKARRRAAADENAAKFGRTRAERAAEAETKARASRHLDGHKREE